MYRFFESFVTKMASSFRRIVYATKQEVTVGDLRSEAWIVASEIGEKRGKIIDFSNSADQDLVMGYLYTRKVRRHDWRLIRAVRIDDDCDDAIKWSERLPANEESDPLTAMLRREAAAENEARLTASYTQAAAYLQTFSNSKYDWAKIAKHLVISRGTLAKRFDAALRTVRVQHSLFDGKARINKRFEPQSGRQYAAQVKVDCACTQAGWDF